MSLSLRRLLAAALLALSVFAFAACGSDDDGGGDSADADKPKPAAQTSPFERGPGMGSPKRALKKKGR